MHDDSTIKLSGEVEADERFIVGKARNMHLAVKARRITGTGTKDKTAVMGVLSVVARFAPPLSRTVANRRCKLKAKSISKLVRLSIRMLCCPTKDSLERMALQSAA